MQKTTVVKNTLILNTATIAANLAAFATSIFIGRYLEKIEFGKFVFIFAFISIFDVFTDLGLSQLATREVSRDKESAARFLVNISFLKIILCIATIIFIWAAARALKFAGDIKLGLLIVGSAVLIESFGRFFGYLFNAFERMEYSAVFSFLLKLITLAGIFFMVKLQRGLISIYAVYFLSAIIFTAISFIFLKRRFIPATTRLDFAFCRKILLKSLPFALFALFWIIYSRIDVTLLKMMKGEEATAVYGAASYILMALMFIPANLSTALFPVFSRLYHNSAEREKFFQYYQKSFFYLLVLALPMAMGGVLLSREITLLIWTNKYIESALAFKILVLRTAIQYLTTILTILMLAADRQALVTAFIFITVAFNIALNLMLIPAYSYIGASISALASMLLYFILFFAYVSRNICKIGLMNAVFKPFLAAVFLGVFIHIFQKTNLFVLLFASAVFYLFMLFSFGSLKIKEGLTV